KRLERKEITESEDNFLLEQVKNKYTDAYECMLKIEKYLGQELSNEEQLYLMLHIQRVTTREK
nr:PRD domain-containing protein [Clostridium sp.]